MIKPRSVVVTGFRVDGILRREKTIKQLSRVFTVKESAETFASIARADRRYSEVYVTAIHKTDDLPKDF